MTIRMNNRISYSNGTSFVNYSNIIPDTISSRLWENIHISVILLSMGRVAQLWLVQKRANVKLTSSIAYGSDNFTCEHYTGTIISQELFNLEKYFQVLSQEYWSLPTSTLCNSHFAIWLSLLDEVVYSL